ncbi:hypothetical protein [Hyphococcus sp.]|uniref:hypothetical protein n=1 Tax=Hyphococcus sp. TaxID=2038636 RepID=UPI003CCC1554
MTRRLKLLTGLSTIAAAGALGLSGCSVEGEGEGGEGETGLSTVAAGEAEGEGGESEGEGEGGESEGSGDNADPAANDPAYLRLLGLVRGHLIAFMELYQNDAREMALMHVKHPESELYSTLAPAIDARGLPGFATQLQALAEAAESGGDVSAAYSAVIGALEAHAPQTSVANHLLGVSAIVRTAADEFDIGVEDDGSISNAHEYQDAYGFLIASREILAGIRTSDVNEVEAIELSQEQISVALEAFESLTATQTGGKPSALYGAAARIEIAARGLI